MTTKLDSIIDVDEEEIGRLLIECGVDVKASNALVKSAKTTIDCEADEEIKYKLEVTLNATEAATFNKLFGNAVNGG